MLDSAGSFPSSFYKPVVGKSLNGLLPEGHSDTVSQTRKTPGFAKHLPKRMCFTLICKTTNSDVFKLQNKTLQTYVLSYVCCMCLCVQRKNNHLEFLRCKQNARFNCVVLVLNFVFANVMLWDSTK